MSPEVMTQESNENATVNETTNFEQEIFNSKLLMPAINLYEDENSFYLSAAMPGLNKENIKVKVENGFLLIMGMVKKPAENLQFIAKEYKYGNYFRKFKLTGNVDREKIDASYENGELVVKLGKNENTKPRTININ